LPCWNWLGSIRLARRCDVHRAASNHGVHIASLTFDGAISRLALLLSQ
jgi:hypothetical protein